MLQADQANPGDSIATDDLWPKRRGKIAARAEVQPIVNEDAAIDEALN